VKKQCSVNGVPKKYYTLTAIIIYSRGTDRLNLSLRHPLWRRHGLLMIQDNETQQQAGHGFGFNGYLRERTPAVSNIVARQVLGRRVSAATINKLMARLTSTTSSSRPEATSTNQYCIWRYNCIDHLLVCLRGCGYKSRLLRTYQKSARRWSRRRGYLG
jgi:hypothetical protein